MKRIIRLTESDLIRIVRRVIKEENNQTYNLPQIKSLEGLLKFLNDLKKKYGSFSDFYYENPNDKKVLLIKDIVKNSFEKFMVTDFNKGGGEVPGSDFRYGTYVIPNQKCLNKKKDYQELRIVFREFDLSETIPTPTWSLQPGSSSVGNWLTTEAKSGSWFFSGGVHYMSYGTKFASGDNPVLVIRELLGHLCV